MEIFFGAIISTPIIILSKATLAKSFRDSFRLSYYLLLIMDMNLDAFLNMFWIK